MRHISAFGLRLGPISRCMCSNNAFDQEARTFAVRIGLEKILNMDLLKQALTHKSFNHGRELYNERLEFLGKHVLKYFATEFVHFKYPRLPLSSLEEALTCYIGENRLAQIGRELGMGYVIRWSKDKPPSDPDGERGVCSLIGAIYHQKVNQLSHRSVLLFHICLQESGF
jgi:dsRNA-specific ribonuclease